MKWVALLILLFVSAAPAETDKGGLITWQPTPGSARIILYRTSGQSPQQSVQRYLEHYNASEELVELNEGTLRLRVGSALEMETQSLGEVPFVVQAGDPSQMMGAPRGKNWFKMLENAGADLYVLPPAADVGLTPSQAKKFRALVAKTFSGFLALGGSDIDPKLYHERNRHAADISPQRDRSEYEMFKTYIEAEQGAAFGICRGMQMMAVATGYKLYQDIVRDIPNHNPRIDHSWDDHQIELLAYSPSYLLKAFPQREKIFVNSIHHQAVDLSSHPHGPLVAIALQVTHQNETPVLEAVQLKNGRGFAVQFHPERMNNAVGHGVMTAMVDVARAISHRRSPRCTTLLHARAL